MGSNQKAGGRSLKKQNQKKKNKFQKTANMKRHQKSILDCYRLGATGRVARGAAADSEWQKHRAHRRRCSEPDELCGIVVTK